MKKFLKITGILFLILALGIVVLYFTGDKNFEVSRSKTIAVPAELVYSKVADYNEFNSFKNLGWPTIIESKLSIPVFEMYSSIFKSPELEMNSSLENLL